MLTQKEVAQHALEADLFELESVVLGKRSAEIYGGAVGQVMGGALMAFRLGLFDEHEWKYWADRVGEIDEARKRSL